MVEAAVQEGIVLKIFKKATWCLVGAGSCDPRRQEWGEWGECRALHYCCIHAPLDGILKSGSLI